MKKATTKKVKPTITVVKANSCSFTCSRLGYLEIL